MNKFRFRDHQPTLSSLIKLIRDLSVQETSINIYSAAFFTKKKKLS